MSPQQQSRPTDTVESLNENIVSRPAEAYFNQDVPLTRRVRHDSDVPLKHLPNSQGKGLVLDILLEQQQDLVGPQNSLSTDSESTQFRHGTNGELEADEISDEDDDDCPDGGLKAYTVLLGAFLGFTADFGLVNSIGAVQSYIGKHQLVNYSSSTTAWIFSVFMFFSYIGGIVSGVLFDEYGVRIPFVTGSLLLVVGLFVTGNCSKVEDFVLSFGFLAGIGCALCMNPLSGVISHWFKKKRARAFGLSTLGGSLGGIAFPLLLNHLYSSLGFKWAMRILSFTILGLLTLSFILIKERLSSARVIFNPSNESLTRSQKIKRYANHLFQLFKMSIDFEALKDPKFFWCTIAASLSELSLVCAMTYYGSYVMYIGYSESNSYMMLTIINAVGIVGRYVPGILADKFGPYNVMIVMIFGVAVSVLALWLGVASTLKSEASLYVFAVVFGLFSSSVLSLTPVCCGAISPTRDFGKRYGTMYLIAGFFFLIGIPIAGAIIGDGSNGGYRSFIAYTGVLAFSADVSWIISRFYIVGWNLNKRV